MKTELYLNPRTKWVQLWEAFRNWIVKSPHVGPDAAKALPTKIAKGASDFSWSDNRVKAILLQDVLDIKYSSLRDGTTWTTSIRFKRARRSIYTCITISHEPASTPVEVKPPRIVKILQSRFGDMTVPVRKKPKVVCEGIVGERISRDAPPQAKPKKTSTRRYDKSATKDWTQKKAAEMLGISERQLRSYKKRPPDMHWPGWEDPIRLQQWKNQRDDRDLMAQAMSRALPYRENATERARRKIT